MAGLQIEGEWMAGEIDEEEDSRLMGELTVGGRDRQPEIKGIGGDESLGSKVG